MFTSDLHPRVPAGAASGGQFTVGGSGSGQQPPPAKPAPAKAAPAKAAARKKPAARTEAQAQADQKLARSVPFAELQRLTTMAHQGEKLTPQQQAVVTAGERAHAEHTAHQAHVKATVKPKAKPKAKTAKKTTAKAKAAPKKPAAKAAPKPTTAAQKKANAAAFHL